MAVKTVFSRNTSKIKLSTTTKGRGTCLITNGSTYSTRANRATRKQTNAVSSSSNTSQAKLWMLQLESYLNGPFPLDALPENSVPAESKDASDAHHILLWWRAYGNNFGPLARVARDILAIAGVSVSVERLFSSSARTMTDARSRLTSESAAKAVITKEWLKQGLGDDVQYLDGVSIWKNGSQI